MVSNLTDEEIAEADDAYEGMCSGKGIAPDSSGEAKRLLRRVDLMYPGYKEHRERSVRNHMEEIETFKYGSRLRTQGVRHSWYTGPLKSKGFWPDYLVKLENSLPAKAVADLDKSTDQILDACANPRDIGSKRKGLVVGYVQSGKTASFEGLIAKAVDSGYRVVIVLAGMFNNLREQTQGRLSNDLGLLESRPGKVAWHSLTDSENDFGPITPPGTVLNLRNNVAVAVVKKNNSVLKNLIRWLRSIDKSLLAERPVLIIDDESDQATPNSKGRAKQISTINRRVRELWKEVQTGTYVAYTATPFANVFIDPNDPDDMYPDDFIFALPEPDGYMGASTFFNLEQDIEHEDDTDLNLATEVPDIEADVLTPRPPNIEDYDPHVTQSLGEAVRWFIVATAIRELRQGVSHSTMLVHTSHRVLAHERLSDTLAEFVRELWENRRGENENFKRVFESQVKRISHGQAEMPAWEEIWERIVSDVLPRVSVAVENGISESRLTYEDGLKTVIVVGGSTLSRGLTLEGLITSFFLRTSVNYDTLLQMGRWFGFRHGYGDLVRVWVAPGLLDDYAHLSRVEADMRERIEAMAREDKSPREIALPILAHDGRLNITSSNRMAAVREAQVGLSGSRRQTVYLDRNPARIAESHRAARDLVSAVVEHTRGVSYREQGRSRPSVLFRGVPSTDIVQFLEKYWVSQADRWLQPENFRDWLNKYHSGTGWNLVLVSGSRASTFDYGHGYEVAPVIRTPLLEGNWSPKRLPDRLSPDADIVNIRALISGAHQVLDLKILDQNGELSEANSLELASKNASNKSHARMLRRLILGGEGLVLLYAIDKDSAPPEKPEMPPEKSEMPSEKRETRGNLEAPDHMIGLSVIFPHVEAEDPRSFYSVEILQDSALLTDEELAQEFEMADDTAYLNTVEASEDEQ